MHLDLIDQHTATIDALDRPDRGGDGAFSAGSGT